MSPPDTGEPGATEESAEERLIAAAVTWFGRVGYDATTVWNLATAAGMTARDLYQRFESKKVLFIAAYDKTYRDFYAHLAQSLQGRMQVPDGSVMEWMDAVIDSLTEFITKNPEVGAFLAVAPIDMARSPDLRELVYNDPQDAMYSVVAGMVERLAATGRLDSRAVPLSVTHLILAILLGSNLLVNVFAVGNAEEMSAALKLLARGSLFGG